MRWIYLVLLVAFVVRLFHFAYPLGELHSWRQADTAAVSRALYSYGPSLWLPVCQEELRHIGSQGEECRIPILNPQFDSYVTIDGKATWMDGRPHTNDTRNHFAEFPLYQAVVAQTALIFEFMPFVKSSLVSMSFWVDAGFSYLDKGKSFIEPKEFTYFSNNFNSIAFDSIVISGRFVSLVSSLISIYFFYLLVKLYFGEKVGLVSSAVFGLLPYYVFWSRTVLPDVMMLMWVLIGLYLFHLWIFSYEKGTSLFSRNTFYLVVFTLSFSLALLMKVFVLFLAIPLLFLLYKKFGFSFVRSKSLWISLVVIVVPFLLWRWWIHSDLLRLSGIPASGWLFNGSGIRLKPAWWYWLFQTRLDHFMFNFTGLGLAMIGGFLYSQVTSAFQVNVRELAQRFSLFWLLVLLSCFLYLLVFATGNVTHEYYQLPLVPFVSVFVALGFCYVWLYKNSLFGVLVVRLGLTLSVLLMVLFGSYKVKDWYSSHNPSFVYAGERVSVLVPDDATVIADFGGDTTMLYYTERPGWSIMEFSIEELIRKGATHYVSAHRTEGVNELAKRYTVIEESAEYVILDLTRPL
jgi:hypothetical protein